MGKSNECKVYEISDVSYFVYLTDTCQRQRWCLDLILGISPSVSQITMFAISCHNFYKGNFEIYRNASQKCVPVPLPFGALCFLLRRSWTSRNLGHWPREWWSLKRFDSSGWRGWVLWSQVVKTCDMCQVLSEVQLLSAALTCPPAWDIMLYHFTAFVCLFKSALRIDDGSDSSNRFLGIMKPVCSIQIPSKALGPWSTPIVFWPWFVIGRPVTGDESLPCSFQCYIARAFQACTSSGKQNQPWIKVTKVLSLLVQRQSKFNPWVLNIVLLRKAGNALVHKVVVVVVVAAAAFVVSLLSSWWFIFGSRCPSHPRQRFFQGLVWQVPAFSWMFFFPSKPHPKPPFLPLWWPPGTRVPSHPKNAIQRIKQSGICNALCTCTFLSLNLCKMNKAQRRIITKKSSALVVFQFSRCMSSKHCEFLAVFVWVAIHDQFKQVQLKTFVWRSGWLHVQKL